MNGFDWSGPSVTSRAYGSIAVHENTHGDLVVRQEGGVFDDDDHWVAIPLRDAELIANAIVERAKEIRAAVAPAAQAAGWCSDGAGEA